MSHSGTKVFTAGELLVTSHGEVIIDEIIPKTRALLVHPERYIDVCFDLCESGPPPCAGDDLPDVLEWELFLLPVHRAHHKHHAPEQELRLKVKWRVGVARTIKWKINVPT